MLKIFKTSDFAGGFKKLPKEIKELFHKQEKIFLNNWLDPRLHIKRIKELPGAYSFRVTRRYRAFFYFQNPEKAIFFFVGHRKDAY